MTRESLKVALNAGADATLLISESSRLDVQYAFNRLKTIENTESLSYTAQAIKNGKLGIARSTKPGDEADLLARDIRLTEYGAPAPYSFPAPAPSKVPAVYSPEVAELSLDAMIEAGNNLSEFLKSLHPDVNGMVGVSKAVHRESIANTKGLEASWQRTALTLFAAVSLVEGQNLVDLWDFQVSTDMGWDVEKLKSQIGERFDLARKNVEIETGSYDVLFTPRSFGTLIDPVLACLDGKAVTRGISPFANRLGEQTFSPSLTIVEDGLLDGGLGSRMYDSQGVPCKRTHLVKNGVLSEYLLDLDTAHKLGCEPIGTGGVGTIQPNNLVVEGGDTPMEELLAGMKRGIVIENTMGAWAGNRYSGQVSGNISMGFLVENGKMVGRVKDCMFSANSFIHLKDHLAALSRETRNVFGMTLPYALVTNVTVSAKKG